MAELIFGLIVALLARVAPDALSRTSISSLYDPGVTPNSIISSPTAPGTCMLAGTCWVHVWGSGSSERPELSSTLAVTV